MLNWKKNFQDKGLTDAELRFKKVYEQNMIKAMTDETMGPLHACFELWRASAAFPKPQVEGEELLIPAYRAFLKKIGAVSKDA